MIILGGRFELGAEVAEGGYSVVHRGLDRDTGAAAAIKLVASEDPAADARAQREARVLSGLEDPAVVRLLGHGFAPDGRLYLATEWIDGATLADVLRRDGITVDGAVAVARQLAGALARAHAAGIVHRDVKPQNVMLRDRDPERAVLLDFGIARPRNVPALTETGTVLGTPGYMAPEQVRADRAAGPPVDLFALGCVLHEMLTGRAAFPGGSFFAVEAKILFGEPPAAPHLPDLVRALLRKDPATRPTAAGVAAELAARAPTRGGPRVRRLEGQEIPTAPDPQPAALVVAVPITGEVVPPAPSAGTRHEQLHDGTLVIVVDGDEPGPLARRAATVALDLHRRAPGACVAVTAGALAALDDVARALAQELVRAGTSGSRAVLIDEATARLLGDAFSVVPDGGTYRLLDED